MQITIEISEERIRKAVEESLDRVFKEPQYSRDGGEAWLIIGERTKEETIEYIKSYDITSIISELVPKYVRGIAEDVVQKEVRKIVRSEMKKLKDQGELNFSRD